MKFSPTTLLSAICHAVITQFLFLNTVKVLFFFFLPTAPDLLPSGEQGAVDPHLAAPPSNLLVFVDFARSRKCDDTTGSFSS